MWRDLAYWQQHHWPLMSTQPIRTHYADMVWAAEPEASVHLLAWQQGSTGFPLVDAGEMRQKAESEREGRRFGFAGKQQPVEALIDLSQGKARFREGSSSTLKLQHSFAASRVVYPKSWYRNLDNVSMLPTPTVVIYQRDSLDRPDVVCDSGVLWSVSCTHRCDPAAFCLVCVPCNRPCLGCVWPVCTSSARTWASSLSESKRPQ